MKAKKIITRTPAIELFPPFKVISYVAYPPGSDAGEFHAHDFFQTLIVLSGEFEFVGIEGNRTAVMPGEMLVIPAGSPHLWGSTTACKTLQISSDIMLAEDFGELATLFGNLAGQWVKLRVEPKELKRILSTLNAELASGKPGTATMAHVCLMELFAKAFRLFAGEMKSGSGPRTDGADEEVFRKALCYIHKNFRLQVTLEELAENSSLGISRFSEIFRARAACSPMKYVIAFRMRKARTLLAYSDMSVSEVAAYLGFTSIHYFSKAFKNFHGHAPSRLTRRKS